MKASRDRTEQFTYSGASNPRTAPASGSCHSFLQFRASVCPRMAQPQLHVLLLTPERDSLCSLLVLRSRAPPSGGNPHPGYPSGTTSTHPYPASYNSSNTDSPLYRPMSAALGAGGPGTSILDSQGKGKGKAPAGGNSDFLALDLGAPSDSQLGAAEGGQGGFMQMELAQQQGDDQYLSSRSTAIETIESTVAELGQIFSQLAHMVAVQGEQVTRIDADTEDIAANVSGAQS